jgi:phytoene/squalene synthetase
MASKAEFYQIHLDRVSRSFAFCIRQLPSPLREWVGLSYLLCRIVDTIEDSSWPGLEMQMSAFARFDAALADTTQAAELGGWQSEFPPSIPQGERLLLSEAPRLLQDYHRFPPQVHAIMRELVHSMSRGMQHFCLARAGRALYLHSLAEVNQYCFFVAGVVGELLTKLLACIDPRVTLSQATLTKAHHFGLFLQKVNLLKDQVGDEKLGRHLVPSRDLVEKSAQENARHALAFLTELPREQKEFRRFCAWSLFLGLESLIAARDSLSRGETIKVSRERMQELIEDVEIRLDDDAELAHLFDRLCARLGWAAPESLSVGAEAVPQWLLDLYQGPLEPGSLSQLGV